MTTGVETTRDLPASRGGTEKRIRNGYLGTSSNGRFQNRCYELGSLEHHCSCINTCEKLSEVDLLLEPLSFIFQNLRSLRCSSQITRMEFSCSNFLFKHLSILLLCRASVFSTPSSWINSNINVLLTDTLRLILSLSLSLIYYIGMTIF
jgi:hypothetical protein